MKRICCKCKKEKSLEDFAKHKRMIDGRDTICKECAVERAREYYKNNKEKIKQYNQQYYNNNREEKIIYQQTRRKKRKDFVKKYKKDKICFKCGFIKWQVLEFHHKNREYKTDKIANIMNKGTLKKLKEEITKCILLCSNCHREYHYFIERKKAELLENVSRTTIYRRKKKEWYNYLKSKISCKECGEKKFWVLDAHHRDEDLKEGELHLMVHNRASNEKILKELSKCDILCANCHQWIEYKKR